MSQQGMYAPLIMPGPLVLSLLGLAFCVWSGFGNAIEICFTPGCELSQEVSIDGISLWWIGSAAFCILTILSLSGRPLLGTIIAGFCVFVDIGLLLLMLLTTPCISCLVVAVLFALVYTAFRYTSKGFEPLRRSWLICIWLIIFVGNGGVIARDAMGTWAMAGPAEPAISVYFSPSCSACRTAVEALKDADNVAFYPVLEEDTDLDKVGHMLDAMAQGDSLATALEKINQPAANTQKPSLGFFDELILHFRLQRNKAHILNTGSSVVPYIEYHGLPASLAKKADEAKAPATPPVQEEQSYAAPQTMPMSSHYGNMSNNTDTTVPIDSEIVGNCGGTDTPPCPE